MITCQSMSCSSQTSLPTLQTVTISFSQLKDKDADLSMKIKEGVGPNGLGILSITDVPEFPSLRQNLLRLSPRLAGLPEEVKKELEDPQSRYSFGWSHGKEQLESGKPGAYVTGRDSIFRLVWLQDLDIDSFDFPNQPNCHGHTLVRYCLLRPSLASWFCLTKCTLQGDGGVNPYIP